MKMLIDQHGSQFTQDGSSDARQAGHEVSLTEAQVERLYSRLAKLINRNTNLFIKCAKTYQLKKGNTVSIYKGTSKQSIQPSNR